MKSRVLFILHLPGPIHGAAMVGKFIQESKVINNSFDADYINLSTSSKLKEIGHLGAGKLISLLTIQLKVLKALFSKSYDLYYMTLNATGQGFYKDLCIVSILKLFRKKIIYHFHNKGISARQHNKVDDLLYRFAFNKSQSILLSSCLYSDIEKYVNKDAVFFCANGIPNKAEIPLEASRKKDQHQACRILFLSNMMVEKGVFVLLQACKILKEKKLEFECHFVGDWSDITESEFTYKVNNYDLTRHVFPHGKKYGAEKHEFFLNTDIFVFPTFNETFGLVNLEAMEFGIPIISTYEGGIPDVIKEGENGFLVPKKNAVALAEKIELLIRQPQLRIQLGLAGKKRFTEYFTIDKFENNFVKTLQKAIENFNSKLETTHKSFF